MLFVLVIFIVIIKLIVWQKGSNVIMNISKTNFIIFYLFNTNLTQIYNRKTKVD